MFGAIRNLTALKIGRAKTSTGFKGVIEKLFRHRVASKAIKGRGLSAKIARTGLTAQKAKWGGGILLAIAGIVGGVLGVKRLTTHEPHMHPAK